MTATENLLNAHWDMKVADLRRELRERSLPVGGVKRVLQARLEEALQAELAEEKHHTTVEEDMSETASDDGESVALEGDDEVCKTPSKEAEYAEQENKETVGQSSSVESATTTSAERNLVTLTAENSGEEETGDLALSSQCEDELAINVKTEIVHNATNGEATETDFFELSNIEEEDTMEQQVESSPEQMPDSLPVDSNEINEVDLEAETTKPTSDWGAIPGNDKGILSGLQNSDSTEPVEQEETRDKDEDVPLAGEGSTKDPVLRVETASSDEQVSPLGSSSMASPWFSSPQQRVRDSMGSVSTIASVPSGATAALKQQVRDLNNLLKSPILDVSAAKSRRLQTSPPNNDADGDRSEVWDDDMSKGWDDLEGDDQSEAVTELQLELESAVVAPSPEASTVVDVLPNNTKGTVNEEPTSIEPSIPNIAQFVNPYTQGLEQSMGIVQEAKVSASDTTNFSNHGYGGDAKFAVDITSHSMTKNYEVSAIKTKSDNKEESVAKIDVPKDPCSQEATILGKFSESNGAKEKESTTHLPDTTSSGVQEVNSSGITSGSPCNAPLLDAQTTPVENEDKSKSTGIVEDAPKEMPKTNDAGAKAGKAASIKRTGIPKPSRIPLSVLPTHQRNSNAGAVKNNKPMAATRSTRSILKHRDLPKIDTARKVSPKRTIKKKKSSPKHALNNNSSTKNGFKNPSATQLVLGDRTNGSKAVSRQQFSKKPSASKKICSPRTTYSPKKQSCSKNNNIVHWTKRPPAPMDPHIKTHNRVLFHWCQKCQNWNTEHGSKQHSYFVVAKKRSALALTHTTLV